MAFSKVELKSFAEQWLVVQAFCSSSHRQWMTSGGVCVDETPPQSFFNLPVVLAFSLLDEVLGSLADQSAYKLKKPRATLGEKMQASRVDLQWRDFSRVNAAKEQRNDLAHRGVLISKAECLKIVEAIGAELKCWGAIS